jgi:hypothetical protein
MNKARRMHRQKTLRQVRDLKGQARGRRLPKGFCLAKGVYRDALKSPLDLSQVEIPATYEDYNRRDQKMQQKHGFQILSAVPVDSVRYWKRQRGRGSTFDNCGEQHGQLRRSLTDIETRLSNVEMRPDLFRTTQRESTIEFMTRMR